MNLRCRLLMLLAALPLLSACKEDKANGDLPTPPIIRPFEAKKGNKVEINTRVLKCNNYVFSLRFGFKENDQLDLARVRKLVGGYEIDAATGKLREPGIPTLVRLIVSEITANGEKPIFEKKADPIQTSLGADNFGKIIGDTYLQPGVYHIVLEVLSGAPEYIPN